MSHPPEAAPPDRPESAQEIAPGTEVASEAAAEAAAPEITQEAVPAMQPAAAARSAAGLSHAAYTTLLQQHFPALFGPASPIRPLKLHIQSDIQTRAPGVFSKAALSQFLRRYTASPAYLQALARTPQRHDLDGLAAGEVSEEHRNAARDELARRRSEHEARRAEQDEARRGRARLLRDFETTTLTRSNFCALKGIEAEALEDVLALARQEAAHRPPLPPPRPRPSDERRHRPPRPGSGGGRPPRP